MSQAAWDAIAIGARCAGSPTAMLLARAGCRVLAVDGDTFPSDTISTHLVHPHGVAALRRWGLLDRLVATGCPPIHTYVFDFGPFAIRGGPGTPDEPISYCPRRTVLDKLLVDAAADAGAEVREGFTVETLLIDDGRVTGVRVHLHARRARAPAPPELATLLAAMPGNQAAMDGFCRVASGVTSPAEFSAAENVKRILEAAHCAGGN